MGGREGGVWSGVWKRVGLTSNLAKEKIHTVARRLHEAAEEGFRHTDRTQEISSQKGMYMLLYG